MPPRAPSTPPPIFHRRGLAYFWVFNDHCDWSELQPQLDTFAKAGDVSALCLHPRPGLLLPYGSSDWFAFIREACRRIAKAGLDVWLYDEDPYPSGAAGGRLFQENKAFNARHIDRFVFDRSEMDDSLFAFPPGEALWAGLVNEETGESHDLTERVGVLRRKWTTWESWDSRFFYPDTPLYKFQRADTSKPEFGMLLPNDLDARMADGFKLVAFVARPTEYDWIPWGGLPDSLNPVATRRFLQMTHEKYQRSMGDMFGKEIKAIFTDEPKYFSKQPWTFGAAEDFKRMHGYDIRPRLFHLWSDSMSDQACLTRLHWRHWCGERFRTSWLKPVSEWCRAHRLNLVGHISPEDDPIEQANYVSNLFPLFNHFDLAGIDLIIPAVGDSRHPILSIGCTSASSLAMQRGKAGVMSETGACTAGISGKDITPEKIGRILKWQTVMGVTSPLMHCAYSSVRGPRAYEYPPNYGPNNAELWPGMVKLHHELAELQEVTHDAAQVAPAAVLWTIRSFQMQNIDWLTDPTGMRRSLMDTLARLLDRQVGTHILDEAVLWDASMARGQVTIGRARYSHLFIPACTVLHEKTVAQLRAARAGGVTITFTGQLPIRMQLDRARRANGKRGSVAMVELDCGLFDHAAPDAAATLPPRLIDIPGDATDIRCTAWTKRGKTRRLLMSLRDKPLTTLVDGKRMTVAPGKVYVM